MFVVEAADVSAEVTTDAASAAGASALTARWSVADGMVTVQLGGVAPRKNEKPAKDADAVYVEAAPTVVETVELPTPALGAHVVATMGSCEAGLSTPAVAAVAAQLSVQTRGVVRGVGVPRVMEFAKLQAAVVVVAARCWKVSTSRTVAVGSAVRWQIAAYVSQSHAQSSRAFADWCCRRFLAQTVALFVRYHGRVSDAKHPSTTSCCYCCM